MPQLRRIGLLGLVVILRLCLTRRRRMRFDQLSSLPLRTQLSSLRRLALTHDGHVGHHDLRFAPWPACERQACQVAARRDAGLREIGSHLSLLS